MLGYPIQKGAFREKKKKKKRQEKERERQRTEDVQAKKYQQLKTLVKFSMVSSFKLNHHTKAYYNMHWHMCACAHTLNIEWKQYPGKKRGQNDTIT